MNKKLLFLTSGIFVFIFLLYGWQSRWKAAIPEADILFYTAEKDIREIGFIQFDGDKPHLVTVPRRFRKPVWSSDGSILLGLAGGKPFDLRGYPAYWNPKEGEFRECSWNMPYFEIIQPGIDSRKPKQVLVTQGKAIILMDLESCKTIEVLVDYDEQPRLIITGFSYLPPTEELLYGLFNIRTKEFQLMKHNLATQKSEMLTQGYNPNWSPDGKEIAFTHDSGIYIMQADGTGSRLLVNFPLVVKDDHYIGNFSPNPRWSPDGEWIIYHIREKSGNTTMLTDFDIYRIHSSGGKPVKVLSGGAFPSWMQ
jgi:hypothetical protein